MLTLSLQVLAFVLAQLGLIAWTRRLTGLDVAFVPALVFSGQGLVVFAGGLLGLLPQAAWGVVVLGLVLLAHEAWRAPAMVLGLLTEPAILLLAGAAAVGAWYLHGLLFTSYDNFSHWAVVVQVMLTEGRFPTADDPVIVFQAYPLGSASFVYLFGRVVSPAEPVLMLAQQLLGFSYVLALLAATPRRRLVGVVAVIVSFLVITTYEIFVNSLLVDTLLGLMSGYLMILLWGNRDRLPSLLLPIATVLAFLAVTKNSGLFTVVVATVAVPVLIRLSMPARTSRPDAPGSHRSGRGFTWWMLPALFAPWAVLLWWNRHVATTFPEGLDSKHSMSAGRLGDVLGEKSVADVKVITRSFATELLGDRASVVLLVALVVAVVLLRWSGLVRRAEAVWLLGGGVLTYGLYVVGILGMFLLSMPLSEALRLAGFHRYLSTAHLAWLIVILWLLLVVVDQAGKAVQQALAAVTGAGTLLVMSSLGSGDLLPRPDVSGSARVKVDAALAAADPVPPGDTVCVVLGERDSGFRRYIVRYALLSPNVKEVVISPEQQPEPPQECAHFLVLDEFPAIDAWLAEQDITAPGPTPYLVSSSR
ncbi:hypothetical protein [Ornithinimicrobium cryptoxanthini]|uniref:hypothetical protein n=1 Tax=Ornithinimicrobium cryptoxanthini TaxID=2934161 RepID=UPI00211821F7|nr:hypothetical protein [Ornithinimicrobium cryptoxanthini]